MYKEGSAVLMWLKPPFMSLIPLTEVNGNRTPEPGVIPIFFLSPSLSVSSAKRLYGLSNGKESPDSLEYQFQSAKSQRLFSISESVEPFGTLRTAKGTSL